LDSSAGHHAVPVDTLGDSRGGHPVVEVLLEGGDNSLPLDGFIIEVTPAPARDAGFAICHPHPPPRRRRGGRGSGPAPKEEGHLRSRAAPRAPTDLATAPPATHSGNIDSRPTRGGALTTADDLAGNVALGRCISVALGGRYREPRGHHESFKLTGQTVGQDRFGGFRRSNSLRCSGSSKARGSLGGSGLTSAGNIAAHIQFRVSPMLTLGTMSAMMKMSTISAWQFR
jgi:hypothetical protein